MALDKTLRDINRRELEFGNNQIAKALPEYFGADYPELIRFLNAYYKWLDSDGNFGHKLKTLPTVRDIGQTAQENLTYIEDELLLGQNYLEGLLDNRTGAELSNNFYRTKGTKYSIERFFRSFYATDPIVSYGKNYLLEVGDSDSIIGPSTEKRIMDDKFYQHYGMKVKVDRGETEWRELYELFVHPAGMYLASEIQIESINKDISFDRMPISIPPDETARIYEGVARITPTPSLSASILVTSDDTLYRLDARQYRLEDWQDSTADSTGFGSVYWIDQQYHDPLALITATSPTMDEDSSRGVITADNIVETMDMDEFSRYDSV